ncbi:MAG: protein kinase [Legionellales bacterium]|jgi:ankyrin repeat protein
MGNIHKAALLGDLDEVKKLVERGSLFSSPVPVDSQATSHTKINDPKKRGDHLFCGINYTALDCAIQENHVDIVRYLHSKGAKNYGNWGGHAFECACRDGHSDVIRYLLENLPPSNDVLAKGLYVAAKELNIAMVKLLIEKGKPSKDLLNKCLFDGLYRSSYPGSVADSNALMTYLVNVAGADLNYQHDKTSIWERVMKSHKDFIKHMIQLQAQSGKLFNVSYLDNVKKEDKEEIYDFYIATCSKLREPQFALSEACGCGDIFFLEKWKSKKMPMNLDMKYKGTLRKNDAAVVDINVDRQGLVIASAVAGRKNVLKWLIDNGADSNVRTPDGHDLLYYVELGKKNYISVDYQNTKAYVLPIQQQNDRLEVENRKARELREQKVLEEEKMREQEELNANLKKYMAMQNSNNASSSKSSNKNSNFGDSGINSMGQISLSLVIPYNDLTIGKKLGSGGFGEVYQATWQHSDVAVKQLRIGNISQDLIDDFKHEATVMAKLRNPHVIQLYGICITQPYCMVMELAANGSLHGVLHSDAQMDWPLRLKIASGTAKGLAFLHGQNPMILHRDIKSMNVLLGEGMIPKLTDFGLAKMKDKLSASTSTVNSAAGTLHWMAPELLDEENIPHTTACDVYSLGILLWEIYSRKIPYDGKTGKQIYQHVVLQEKRETINQDCPVKFKNLITQCWAPDKNARPAAVDVVKDLESQRNTANSSNATSSGYASFS